MLHISNKESSTNHITWYKLTLYLVPGSKRYDHKPKARYFIEVDDGRPWTSPF